MEETADGDARQRRGGRGRGEREGKSARPQGHEAITKLQKLTIKPGRHTGATIKLAGRPANRRIFLAFTTNHAPRNAVRSAARSPGAGAGGFSRGKKIARRFCSAIRNAAVKRLFLPPPLSLSLSLSASRASSRSSPLPPPPSENPLALRKYESVSWNDEGTRSKSRFLRCCSAIGRLQRSQDGRAKSQSRVLPAIALAIPLVAISYIYIICAYKMCACVCVCIRMYVGN